MEVKMNGVKEIWECNLIESEKGYGQKVLDTKHFTTFEECQVYKVNNQDFTDEDTVYVVEIRRII